MQKSVRVEYWNSGKLEYWRDGIKVERDSGDRRLERINTQHSTRNNQHPNEHPISNKE
jgi:hypothetical protein